MGWRNLANWRIQMKGFIDASKTHLLTETKTLVKLSFFTPSLAKISGMISILSHIYRCY
jgi:hypothetical protein